jgi:hypothetical protein
MTLESFDKWAINFVGPISPPMHIMGVRYIITTTKYFMWWVKAASFKDFTTKITTWLILENVITRFGCPKVIMRNQGSHFLNETIRELL